jgi:hypothetical protein
MAKGMPSAAYELSCQAILEEKKVTCVNGGQTSRPIREKAGAALWRA